MVCGFWSGNGTETGNGSRTLTWIGCSEICYGNGNGSCSWTCCASCAEDYGCGFSVHVHHRTSSARLHGGCSANLAGARIAPFARAARARPEARRPWRPLRPQRPAYHGNEQRQTHGFLSCTGPSGCRRPRPGRTSQKPAAAFQGTCGKSDCRLLKMSCPRRRAEVCRSSS